MEASLKDRLPEEEIIAQISYAVFIHICSLKRHNNR